ncbi:MAG TPA: ABC transporter permease [Acidimicrobiia bacterium]|nr:ABC transporter permease [Acidimicrobiia bacterium]
MSAAATLATATRVLRQLRRDPRTVALLVVVPALLLTLVRFAINTGNATFDRFGVPLVGIFPLVSMFLVTSIAVLRERTSGTLERLLTLPVAKLDILAGYGLAFAGVAALQGTVLGAVGVGLLGLDSAGPTWFLVVLAVANAVLGMALGLFLSAFAATEFQAVQFMPAFLLPQLVLCGLTVPRPRMAEPLRLLSDVLPLTYAYRALDSLRTRPGVAGDALADLGVILAVTLVALGAGAATLRRRTP